MRVRAAETKPCTPFSLHLRCCCCCGSSGGGGAAAARSDSRRTNPPWHFACRRRCGPSAAPRAYREPHGAPWLEPPLKTIELNIQESETRYASNPHTSYSARRRTWKRSTSDSLERRRRQAAACARRTACHAAREALSGKAKTYWRPQL